MLINGWRMMSFQESQQKGYAPNRIYQNKDRHVVIEARRSPPGDFGLMEKAICAAMAALPQGKVTGVTVRLVERNGTIVNQMDLPALWKRLKDEHVRSARWWVTDKFELADLSFF